MSEIVLSDRERELEGLISQCLDTMERTRKRPLLNPFGDRASWEELDVVIKNIRAALKTKEARP
jgi:hypothetical protein